MTDAAATPATSSPRRVLLKLSGEALMGASEYGIDPEVVREIAGQVAEAASEGIQIAVVVGGGNIFRGLAASARGMDRATGAYMSLLARVMTGRAMQGAAAACERLARVV